MKLITTPSAPTPTNSLLPKQCVRSHTTSLETQEYDKLAQEQRGTPHPIHAIVGLQVSSKE